jgi:KRAB domain-containing zinc finger protein
VIGNLIEVSTPVKHEIKEVDSNETEFTCSDCRKVFSSKSKLTSHMSNMHVVGEYLCQLCGEKFTLKKELKNHTEKAHAKKADGVCQFCSKTFKYLSSHIKDVHMKEECICPHCAKTFHNKKHLNGHLAAVHPGEGQTRICPVCSKQFKNSQYLRQHVRLVHETVEDVDNYISCAECGKQFANKAHLYHHTRAVHVVENCNCILCGRTYKNKTALGKHMKHAHDGMVKNPYSGGAEQKISSPARTSLEFGSPASTDTSFQSGVDTFPRPFFSQSGWYSHQGM